MSAFTPPRGFQGRRMIGAWARGAARSTCQRAVSVRARLARWRVTQRRPDEVVELIPPRAEREDALDTLALENLFQSLLLSAREPIALEIPARRASGVCSHGQPPRAASRICALNCARMRLKSRCGVCPRQMARRVTAPQP